MQIKQLYNQIKEMNPVYSHMKLTALKIITVDY